MALSKIEQAIYNAVRQEGPGPVSIDSVIAKLQRSHRDIETLEKIWSLIDREILELTENRDLKIVERR